MPNDSRKAIGANAVDNSNKQDIAVPPPEDKNYVDEIVDEVHVTYSADNTVVWRMRCKSGHSVIVRPPEDPKEWRHKSFAPGDVIRLYSKDNCRTVYGIAQNGKVLFYSPPTSGDERTDETQLPQDMLAFIGHLTAKVASQEAMTPLPDEFKERIQGFRERRPESFVLVGPYETYCSLEAMKIVRAALEHDNPSGWIDRLLKSSPDEILRLVPTLDPDNSVSTFVVACTYARCFIENPEILRKLHSGLCSLAGCDACGCYAVSEEAEVEREALAASNKDAN